MHCIHYTDTFWIYRPTKKRPYSSLKIQQASPLWSLPWTNSTATSTLPQRSHTIPQFKLQWSSHARRSIVIIRRRTFHRCIESPWVSHNPTFTTANTNLYFQSFIQVSSSSISDSRIGKKNGWIMRKISCMKSTSPAMRARAVLLSPLLTTPIEYVNNHSS